MLIMKLLGWMVALVLMSESSEVFQQTKIHTPASFEEAIVAEPQTLLLWPNGAPGALDNAEADRPALSYYPPVNPTETAVVIAPGGGYSLVAMNHEGRQIANWLNAIGVTAFVLRYRIGPKYHHPIELSDAQRAVRMVRARAKEFGVQPDRIGIMGFSAGGHLASTVATHFDNGNHSAQDPVDRAGCRPDFAILVYPVISFTASYTHHGSVISLLGDNPDPRLLRELSNELQVTPQTPPTFLFSTGEDTAVPPENSVAFYLALRKAGVPAELHIFEKGPHGVGLALSHPALSMWPTLLTNWLRGRGLLQSS
jgi:acetyl esterase/lipase